MGIHSPVLTVVVPCFNEEEVLPETFRRLNSVLRKNIERGSISGLSHVLYVDDGSSDNTWSLIEEESRNNSMTKGARLAHNRGHQFALLAGLECAVGDVTISIDADLQDDTSVISDMVDQFRAGNDIVYGVRSSRGTDTFFKRNTAQAYYWLLEKLGVRIVYNHADYRLMSRRVVDALRSHGEVNLFLRGLIPTLGFKSGEVSYERQERFAGESKYPLVKMLALAVEGITSFSVAPLRLISAVGFIVFLVSMLVSTWAAYTYFFTPQAIPGWTSSVLPMYLLGGVQLLSLGVIGEYIAKTYLETKGRPRYVVMEETGEVQAVPRKHLEDQQQSA